MKAAGCFIPFLIFLWLLSFHQGKESNRMLKTVTWLKDKSVADRMCWQGDSGEFGESTKGSFPGF